MYKSAKIGPNGEPMETPFLCRYVAGFYMSSLESYLLSQNLVSNPILYVRYIDDILAIFNSKNHIHHFVRRLQNNSVLKFTSELMKDNTFNFLDVKLTINNGVISTSVIKPTDKGTYSNFNSHTLTNYKISVVKTLLHRAIKVSSSWEEVHNEVDRLQQVFANNGYPQSLVEKIINNTVDRYIDRQTINDDDDINDVFLFVQFDNIETFKTDEKTLKNIISRHVKHVDNNAKVNVKAYYKPSKLSSKFSTRVSKPVPDRANVVYQLNCTEDRCNAFYIGYTTNTLLTRCKQHRYQSSSIYSHYSFDHSMRPPDADTLINNFKILYSFSNLIDLKVAEAISIKKENPFINVKYNDFYNILKLF
jgi:Txe/YoeB family toxin of Txe-Axe toxin-antitoxin module